MKKKKKKICLSKDLNQSVLHSIKVLITKIPGHMKHDGHSIVGEYLVTSSSNRAPVRKAANRDFSFGPDRFVPSGKCSQLRGKA